MLAPLERLFAPYGWVLAESGSYQAVATQVLREKPQAAFGHDAKTGRSLLQIGVEKGAAPPPVLVTREQMQVRPKCKVGFSALSF